MSRTIQVKRGLKADLPTLATGEFGFCEDTKEIFIGDGTINNPVGRPTNYPHHQIVPAKVWTINHGLGRYPSVMILDSAGSVVYGDIKHVSENEVILSFTTAFAGRAYLD